MPSDRLGRCVDSLTPPISSAVLLLPQSAYRLLLDFLKFDKVFCNSVVPRFHQLGWVSLSLVNAESEKGQQIRPTSVGEEQRDGCRRASGSAALAFPQKQIKE